MFEDGFWNLSFRPPCGLCISALYYLGLIFLIFSLGNSCEIINQLCLSLKVITDLLKLGIATRSCVGGNGELYIVLFCNPLNKVNLLWDKLSSRIDTALLNQWIYHECTPDVSRIKCLFLVLFIFLTPAKKKRH